MSKSVAVKSVREDADDDIPMHLHKNIFPGPSHGRILVEGCTIHTLDTSKFYTFLKNLIGFRHLWMRKTIFKNTYKRYLYFSYHLYSPAN
jgi:hypothetical protein